MKLTDNKHFMHGVRISKSAQYFADMLGSHMTRNGITIMALSSRTGIPETLIDGFLGANVEAFLFLRADDIDAIGKALNVQIEFDFNQLKEPS